MEIYWLHHTIFRKKVNQRQKKSSFTLWISKMVAFMGWVAQNGIDVG